MKALIAAFFSTMLFSCSKQVDESLPIILTPTASELSHAEIISDKINTFKTIGKWSDTMAVCVDGGGVVFVGNSLIENWKWYNWDRAFTGLPVINRGVGGSRFVDMFPHIGITITCYQPSDIYIYMGENEYARGQMAKHINIEFIKYYNEVRRQNPEARINIISMQACPSLMKKILDYDIDYLNQLYQRRIKQDIAAGFDARYIDVKQVTQKYVTVKAKVTRYAKPDLFLPDGIHMNVAGYEVWARSIVPYLTN